MKHTYLYIASSALLLLSACTADDIGEADSLVPVRLTASQSDLSIEGGMTRAADGLYTASTGFSGGETVKVYLNGSSANYAVSTTNKTTLTGGTLYYPVTGSITLFAVYPYTSITSHTVKYNQTTDANYKASDLMYAKNTTVSQSNKSNTQSLSFSHQMAKLKVNIVKGSGVTAVTSVKMKNVLRTVPVSPTSSSIGLGTVIPTPSGNSDYNSSDNNAILLSSSSNTATNQTYCCVFPAAQQWSGTDFIEVTADGKTLTCTLTRESFTAGYEYTLTLNVNASTLGSTVGLTGWTNTQSAIVNIDYGVALSASAPGYIVTTDAMCYNPSRTIPSGKTKAGVVVYKNGSHGYVVSLFNCGGSISYNGTGYLWENRENGLSSVTTIAGHAWIVGTVAQYTTALTSQWDTAMNYITNAGGRAITSYCWSDDWEVNTNESTGMDCWYFSNGGHWSRSDGGDYYNVRPIFYF